MFIDRAVVKVIAGTGGSGASSFARFKFKPKGGPDGGDGGHGGHVFIRGDANLATLLDYRYRTIWKAGRGEHGKGKTKTGASAEDIYMPVPPGTIVRDVATGEGPAIEDIYQGVARYLGETVERDVEVVPVGADDVYDAKEVLAQPDLLSGSQ